MVKIGIFAIVFVYFCEINAEVANLQSRITPAADVRRILSSKRTFAGNKSVHISLRRDRFATGLREDKDYVLRHGEPRYNDLGLHMVKKRRFKRSYRDEEKKQIDEHDNEPKNPKKRKRHHHHSRRKMNKNHNSTRNRKTKRYKNTKRNDMEEKDNEDKNKKHHLGGKMNKYNDSTRNRKTKRYKNTKRNDMEEKYNEDKNKKHHLGGKMNKNHNSTRNRKTKRYKNTKRNDMEEKDNEDKNKKHHLGGKMNKYNDSTRYKEKKGPKNEDQDRHMNKDKKLNKKKNESAERNIDKNHSIYAEHPKKDKDKINKKKQAKDKSKTAIGMAGLGAAGIAALAGKSLASTKGPNPVTEHVLRSRTTSNPKQEVTMGYKLNKRERLNLRTQEKIRVTKIIPYSLREEKKEAILRQRKEGSKLSSAGSPPSNLSPYAITAQMELLMKEFSDVNATVLKSGRTVEYNDIVLVSITANKDEANFRATESKYIDEVPEKKIIFIVHGLTVMGLKEMTSLVKSSELKILLSYYFKHLDKFDFFLMPLANPDGYSASLSSDRAIWNKNVSPQSVCPGVFVDRNFDVAWTDTLKISSCSQLYPGASPFSEEESRAVRNVFHRFGHKILAYIHVHAGTFDEKVFKGDAILYPRGYTETQSDDDKYIDIKGEIDEAMKNASFRVMSATVDTLSNWYGVVRGTSVDYAATVYGIPYAMEFVMQLYDSESMNNIALTEIWSRLIDATFNKMWNSLQAGGDA